MVCKRVIPLLLLIAALLLAGCGSSVSSAPPTADSSSQQVPFQSEGTAASATNAPPHAGAVMSKLAGEKPLVIPTGTPVEIRMQQSISSATASSGQSFDAVLAAPLVVNGKEVAPRYAEVTGRVVAVRRSGRLHNAGFLRLALASIRVNGRSLPVQSSSVMLHGGSYKKRNTAWIGGGAGAGAVVGALAGGGKGALIGSAVGAGAGTAGAYATGKKDVAVAAERKLSFRLTEAVTVQ